jgi:uncharacterized RDD family membrane protein YckC
LKVAENKKGMQTIRVHTTQNVSIQYPLASLGDRILAYLLDRVFIIAYLLAIYVLFSSLKLEVWWIWVAFTLIPYIFYHLVFEIFMNGQSPGKRILKIQVIRLDGSPATVGDFILRWLFALVEMGLIAVIVIAAGGKGQRLGDMVAGTTVIKLVEEKEITAQQVFVTAEENYSPVFTEVTQLSTNDIEVIQRALEVNRDHGNSEPVMLVAQKIKALLGIQSDLPPVKFLYTVIKDYNHLTSH